MNKEIIKEQIEILISESWERYDDINWYNVYINWNDVKIFKEWELVWTNSFTDLSQMKFFIYYIIKD